MAGFCEHVNETSCSIKCEESDELTNVQLLKKGCAACS